MEDDYEAMARVFSSIGTAVSEVEGTGVAMGVGTLEMPWNEAKVEDEGQAVT